MGDFFMSRLFFSRVLLVACATAAGMAFYEFLKQWLWPDITIWHSHYLTITFSTIIASLATYVAVRRYESLRLRANRDMQALSAAEWALRSSEIHYRALFNSARDAIFILRGDVYEDCNPAAIDLFACSNRNEIIGNTCGNFSPPQQPDGRDSASLARELASAAKSDAPQMFEWRHIRLDGTYVDTEVHLSRIEIPPERSDGEFRLLAVVRDITHRKQAQHLLERQVAFDALVTDLLGQFASSSASEIDGIIQDALKNVVQFLGGDQIHIILLSRDLDAWSVVHRWQVPGVPDLHLKYRNVPLGTCPWGEKILLSGTVLQIDTLDQIPSDATFERELYTREGLKSLLEVPLRGRGRAIMGSIGVRMYTHTMRWRAEDLWRLRIVGDAIVNVLERKHAEENLKDSARRKDEFLAMLGHELRNPLAPIRNASFVLRNTALNDRRAKQAGEIIERQAAHLSRIVDDLLDVSRIARNKISVRRTPLDLARLIRVAADDYRHTFDAKGLALQVTLPSTPVWINGDETRLAQIVGNLLHNAQKFTDCGSVVVELREDRHEKTAVLTVRDSGIGMSPETIARVFDPFTQANVDLARARGGVGLGMAMVKGLVELHGGTVRAESRGIGLGSIFTLSFPLSDSVAAQQGAAAIRPPAVPRKVLVIEDNPDAAESLKALLELMGFTVLTACDGPTGLMQAREFVPDIILCDIGLPGDMDGYAVCQAIRADSKLHSIYMAALTGYGQEADKRRATEAGFDVHLTKPVEPNILERLLIDPVVTRYTH
jgi:PAS domain S-box-containing protein